MEALNLKKQEKILPEELFGFINDLSEITDEKISLDHFDDTYEIETDNFTLTFTIKNNIFEIRSIKVRGNSGLGTQIIETIHKYADEKDLEVIASNVLDTARGFWEKMGYQENTAETESEVEYFRVA